MKLTFVNFLTLLRIAIIPVFVLTFYIPFDQHYVVSAVLFLIAAITDWLDGFLARYWDQTSLLGAFLVPVADKLMVATALVLLVSAYPYWWVSIPVVIVICREITVSALRELMADLGKRASVKVSYIGKVKTTFQMISIFLLLLLTKSSYTWGISVGFVLLYGAAILTVYSMVLYLQAAYYEVKSQEN